MATITYYFVSLLVICVVLKDQVNAKRKSGSGGGGRRGGGGGSHTTPRSHDTYDAQQTYQTGNHNPSAPLPPQNNQGIGFENAQRPPSYQNHPNGQGIGFENVQRSPPYQSQPNNQGIGFENVHQRVGPPNQSQPPAGSPPYQNNQNRFGGQTPYYQQPGYHPNQNTPYYQPGSYYTPHNTPPNGIQPQIYQPIQQQTSSGSNLLGYAGTFAGGFLIGKLTSGGFHDSNDREYTVNHYHNNRDQVPQKLSVSDNGLVDCSQNDTKALCVPNTFPLCLSNGTILCVTHLPYTTPCGSNSSMACVVTVLPCPSNATCDAGNSTTTAVYVPCISNVTISRSPRDPLVVSNQPNKVELCVTAIAEPKLEYSAAGSYMLLIADSIMLPIELAKNYTDDANSTTTVLPFLNQNETIK